MIEKDLAESLATELIMKPELLFEINKHFGVLLIEIKDNPDKAQRKDIDWLNALVNATAKKLINELKIDPVEVY